MSRGPGRAQRAILTALRERPTVYLVELAEAEPGITYQSLWRAAWALAKAGRLNVHKHGFGMGSAANLLLTVPGYVRIGWPKCRVGSKTEPVEHIATEIPPHGGIPARPRVLDVSAVPINNKDGRVRKLRK